MYLAPRYRGHKQKTTHMKIQATSSGANFPVLEEGSYLGRLYSIIYLGTQHESYQGVESEKEKINISFVLPEELIEIKGEQKPRVISVEIAWSGHKNATFRKYASLLMGKEIGDGEVIDLKDLLGKECQVVIGHTSGGKAKITNLLKLKANSVVPASDIPFLLFDNAENFSKEVYEKFPEFIQDKINSAKEFELMLN
jgi:hypothetical protein